MYVVQGGRLRNIPAAGYPVSATAGGVLDLAPYPQPPSGPGPNPLAETSLREEATKGDLQPDITGWPLVQPTVFCTVVF